MTSRWLLLALPLVLAASSSLDEAIDAFESGDHAEAARLFEEGGPRDEAVLRSYDAGVAWLASGDLDRAIERLEEASVSGEGKLRAAALHNLALAHARRGDVRRSEEPEDEKRTDRIARLREAAESYRRALTLFRRVPPPAPDAETGTRAAKVRLLATLDEVRRLEEEAREEAEEEKLEDPAGLVLELMTGERDRRRTAVRLAALERRRARRALRALRETESDARRLTEKLAVAIENPPGESATTGAPPLPEELARRAADSVHAAARAMGEAEGRLQGLDAAAARAEQTRAIAALRTAGRIVAAPLGRIVAKVGADQATLLQITDSGARGLVPEEQDEIGAWLEALSTLPDPPEPQEGQPAPDLDAETVARIRELAGEAHGASNRAAGHLAGDDPHEAVPDQSHVVECLAKILDLLPRPPRTPAERIRDLIAQERVVGKGVEGLEGLNDEARRALASELETRSRTNGREAGAVAEELETSPGENEKAAGEKVREAEGEIFDAAENLARDRAGPAGEATNRAVERLEEALAILSGKRPEPQQGEDERDRNDSDGGEREGEEEAEHDARRLDAAGARRMMEEMDRDRRELERKLFPGGGGMKVDKDW